MEGLKVMSFEAGNSRGIFIRGARTDLKKIPPYPLPSHFSKEMLKPDEIGISKADVDINAFTVNGFPKEELKDLWWNTKLDIFMNRKGAADTVLIAYRKTLIEGLTGKGSRI